MASSNFLSDEDRKTAAAYIAREIANTFNAKFIVKLQAINNAKFKVDILKMVLDHLQEFKTELGTPPVRSLTPEQAYISGFEDAMGIIDIAYRGNLQRLEDLKKGNENAAPE